jgi:stalled ribosome rescue protein Dom34
MNAHQTVVWLDHQEARIFGVDAEKLKQETVAAPKHHFHRHPKGSTAEHHHPGDGAHFFKEIAAALTESDEVLLLGPSTAKLEFLRYLTKQDHTLEEKVVGVETADHPSDGQLVAHARRYFDRSNSR